LIYKLTIFISFYAFLNFFMVMRKSRQNWYIKSVEIGEQVYANSCNEQ